MCPAPSAQERFEEGEGCKDFMSKRMDWVGKGLGWVQPGMRAEKYPRFGSLCTDVLNHHGSQQYISQHGFDSLYFPAFIND